MKNENQQVHYILLQELDLNIFIINTIWNIKLCCLQPALYTDAATTLTQTKNSPT